MRKLDEFKVMNAEEKESFVKYLLNRIKYLEAEIKLLTLELKHGEIKR